jgi:hypothetical protein
VFCGIYIREGSNGGVLEQLADMIWQALRPDGDATQSLADDFVPLMMARAKNSAA